MGARGTGLDFALHYMSQLRDDHAILNTYVHAHTHRAAGVRDFQGALINWLLTQPIFICSAKY